MYKTTIKNIRHEPEWSLLKAIRHEVFVLEQGLDACVVEDSYDDTCTHIYYTDGYDIIASCRFREEADTAFIERVSVSKAYRKQSLGRKLIETSLEVANHRNIQQVKIVAQSQVSGMYEKFGFVTSGSSFTFYGTSHIRMVKYLD